jgi:hypothetical protein
MENSYQIKMPVKTGQMEERKNRIIGHPSLLNEYSGP